MFAVNSTYTQSVLTGVIRHVLTLASGVLVTHGVVDADLASQLVGVGMGVVGLLWSATSKQPAVKPLPLAQAFVEPVQTPVLLPPPAAPPVSGFVLSDVSRTKLTGVDAALRQIVETAITLTPVDFRVTEGLRTAERQAELLRDGKSWIKRSKHQDGLAVDLVALPNNEVSWDWQHYVAINEAMQEAASQHGYRLTWGGGWKQRDGVHWQLEGKLS